MEYDVLARRIDEMENSTTTLEVEPERLKTGRNRSEMNDLPTMSIDVNGC